MTTGAVILTLLLVSVAGIALWRRRGGAPHPHARELEGLVSCLVAWRRAELEAAVREPDAPADALRERLSALAWYAEAAGVSEPLTREVVAIPLGELDEELLLEAHWRIETAGGIAWALDGTEGAHLACSRTYERARALRWVLGEERWVEGAG